MAKKKWRCAYKQQTGELEGYTSDSAWSAENSIQYWTKMPQCVVDERNAEPRALWHIIEVEVEEDG